MKQRSNIAPADYFIEPGYILVAAQPAVISGVLGSCVSVCLFDRRRKVGGMNQFQYPFIGEKNRATAIYGNVSTLALIRMMIADGSKTKHLEAQIIGGGHNPALSSQNIGRENVRMARRILIRHRIRVASEDVGGEKGRKVVFNTHQNEVAVMKVSSLRSGDWYPYQENR
jgi:chemotaxis protein CheD